MLFEVKKYPNIMKNNVISLLAKVSNLLANINSIMYFLKDVTKDISTFSKDLYDSIDTINDDMEKMESFLTTGITGYSASNGVALDTETMILTSTLKAGKGIKFANGKFELEDDLMLSQKQLLDKIKVLKYEESYYSKLIRFSPYGDVNNGCQVKVKNTQIFYFQHSIYQDKPFINRFYLRGAIDNALEFYSDAPAGYSKIYIKANKKTIDLDDLYDKYN